MVVHDGLKERAQNAAVWLLETSFPFWEARCVDPRGGFRERLTADGGVQEDPDSRVRLQARQTYCFSLAYGLGWRPERALELVERGLDTLERRCRRPDGLYGKRVGPEGLTDETADLYDTAFALLAFSTAAKETGSARAAGLAEAVFDAINAELKLDGRKGDEEGYVELLPRPIWRLQNPHMHLFEASQALMAACEAEKSRARFAARTGEAAAAQAARLKALSEKRFVDARTGILFEVFDKNWSPAADTAGKVRVEPGHLYEWVWLLAQHARLTGTDLSPAAAALYAAAQRLTEPDGRLSMAVTPDGEKIDATRRTWLQTEALKAHLVMAEHGDAAAADLAVRAWDLLWADHMANAVAGGWRDHVDAAGAPVAADMTAATGYHLFCAIIEMMRVTETPSPAAV